MLRINGGVGDGNRPVARICGHRWTDEVGCTDAGEHVCWRTSREHRSHICTCEAIELRSGALAVFSPN
jgi:hypothetical protein